MTVYTLDSWSNYFFTSTGQNIFSQALRWTPICKKELQNLCNDILSERENGQSETQ